MKQLPIKCTPCRINYKGQKYRILSDGSVTGTLTESQMHELGLPNIKAVLDYEVRELRLYGPHTPEAKTIRREAARLRRNRNARERNQANAKEQAVRRKSITRLERFDWSQLSTQTLINVLALLPKEK